MFHIRYGGAGSGKSAWLMQQIRQSIAAGESVRTLVPEQFAFSYDRRLYEFLGAADFHRCRTGTFRILTAEILSAVSANPRDAADDVTKTVVLHRVLQSLSADNALRFYGGQADSPAFFAQLQKQLAEWMQSGSTPEQLVDAAAKMQGVLPEKIMDISRIYADYLNELEQRGLRDVLCDTVTAAAAAEGMDFFRGETLFLDEYESFTGDQYLMLEGMLCGAKDVYIALRTDAPDAPDYSRFDAVNQTLRRLCRMAKEADIPVEMTQQTGLPRFHAPSLAHLSTHILTAHSPAFEGEAAVTVCEARDATLEAEYTAAMIRRLLMEGGLAAKDIMVVTHDLAAYGALLEPAFRRYEIPFFMDLRRSVLHTAAMQLPICLLQLARHISTDRILTLLKTQLSPLSQTMAAELENYAYTWDIEGEQWETPFVPETDAEGIHEEARETLIAPILRLRKQCGGGKTAVSGAQLCEALYRCLDDMGVPMRVGGLAAHMRDSGDLTGGRALRKLWNRLTELLDALHDALTDTFLTPMQLADLLTTVLRQNQIPVPPQTLDAVTVQSAAAARFDAPKAVFVLGVSEGAFPADIQSGGFFSEQERGLLEQHGVELSRSVRDLCADERLIAYKTLSAPSELLFLSYPLADECGRHLNPAPILTQVRQLLPNLQMHFADRMGTEFYVSTKAAAYYSFVEDYAVPKAEREAVRTMLAQSQTDCERLERLRAAANPARLTVSDKSLMRKLTSNRLYVSATQINSTMQCVFRGFCENGLRLYAREKKNLSPLSVGNLVHYCMEQLFLRYPTREAFLSLSAADLKAHAADCAAAYLKEELGGGAGRPQRFLQQYHRLTKRMEGLLLHTQAEMAQSQFAPDACELVIGTVGGEKGTAPYQLTLPNGMTLSLNGKIDRVDLCELNGEQYLRIVDYKTGRKQYHSADIYYGLNLQMLLYLFALTDSAEQYRGIAPAGVLYMPASAPKADRKRDDTTALSDYINQYFRMSGTVLCDRGILSAMEADIAGIYIPAKLAAEDTGTGEPVLTKDSQVFTQAQLARLRKYVEETVAECMVDYAEGNLVPRPMKKRSPSEKFYENACEYCKYQSICGVDAAHYDACRENMTEADTQAAMQAILDGTEADSQ